MNSWLEYKLEAAETFVCRMYGLEHVVAAEKSRCIIAASFYTRQNVSKLGLQEGLGHFVTFWRPCHVIVSAIVTVLLLSGPPNSIYMTGVVYVTGHT